MGAVAEEGGRTREERPFGALPLRPLARKGRGAPIGAHPATPPVTGRSSPSALGPSPSSAPFLSSASLLFSLSLLICLVGAVGAKSDENSHGDGSAQRNRRITCYTCVNVSTNDECNRFAIDRPCPEGGDFCLTLHVMEGKDRDRSLLVNKRCASLEDCAGDYTGCTTAYGQTQCVSCCDQPYCNDSVPSNDTNAVFYRSVACSITADRRMYGVIWTVAAALIPTLTTLRFGALK